MPRLRSGQTIPGVLQRESRSTVFAPSAAPHLEPRASSGRLRAAGRTRVLHCNAGCAAQTLQNLNEREQGVGIAQRFIRLESHTVQLHH